ncbi:hypothetical protein J8N05_09805 [Streptomyces sp. BH-SS-21]|uniref:Uncharacterized protein n=2 Tax=Streptomyces TaxID=1883 RepID=A0A941B7Z9_9ACTN|nr:hypothetical protein [Streptomyces liliiviolaceus]
MTAEFHMKLDEGMLGYFREIADEMVGRFGISRAEAVARINERYGGTEMSPYPDLMCHELPEFWAYGPYYYPDDAGRLPTGDASADVGIDVTRLRIRPRPPEDSPAWTLRGDVQGGGEG